MRRSLKMAKSPSVRRSRALSSVSLKATRSRCARPPGRARLRFSAWNLKSKLFLAPQPEAVMSAGIVKAALIAQLLLLLPSPARAAEITLTVTIGYHGVFQLGRPFPIRVEVANTGPPVEGTVEATVWKGGGAKGIGSFPMHHRRTLLIGAAGRKSAAFTIDPGSVSQIGRASCRERG